MRVNAPDERDGASRRTAARRTAPPHDPMLDLQRSVGNAAVARMLARKPLTLPRPKRSDEGPPLTIESSERERLKQWIDEAAVTNRPALEDLIRQLTGEKGDTEQWVLGLARAARGRGTAPLVDAFGGARVTPGLVEAARIDIARSRGYLQEGDGHRLANHWDVRAEVFDQPNSGEPIVRTVTSYGTGSTTGHLLFVNGNHYVVIEPCSPGEATLHAADGRTFKRSSQRTVSDGNCLVDGLHIVAHNRNAGPQEIQEARRHLSRSTPDDEIERQLEGVIAAVAAGEEPQGVGPEVTEALEADEGLRTLHGQARAKASAPTPQIGVEGASFLGPSRVDGAPDKEAIHRGEAEVERRGDTLYIRLYTTVPSAAKLEDVDASTGSASSLFKDVQQDVESGKILISSGNNSMLWVSAGRPLRAVKWAEKYRTDKAGTLKFVTEKAEAIKQKTKGKHWDAERRALEKDRKSYEDAGKTVTEKDAPLIRSYLVPLDAFNEISKKAVLESMRADRKDDTFNVDRHAEPNQFGVMTNDQKTLRESALPGSLITYAYDTKYARGTKTAGEVRPVQELWERLGAPGEQLKNSPWVKNGEFQDRKALPKMAETLNMHYVTWREKRGRGGTRSGGSDVLMGGKGGKIPPTAREKQLTQFLAEHGVGPEREAEFMEKVVAPWANQAAIEAMLAEDYERMNRDEDVVEASKSSFTANAFGAQVGGRAERERHLAEVGAKIDTLVAKQAAPDVILDFLIDAVPELKGRYAKVSAKSEGYQFYEHAQMVLGQFRKLNRGEQPLFDEAMFTKLILFHDIEKTNSKAQYGKDPVGEHKLTVDEIRKYGTLFKRKDQVDATVAMVGGDPFGEYMKSKKGPEDRRHAFMAIVTSARQIGLPLADYPRFFREFHQFYQADFSSYSSASRYRSAGPKDERKGKGGAFDKAFEWEDKQDLERAEDGSRFVYAAENEAGYQALEAMFADEGTIFRHILELDPAFEAARQAKAKAQASTSASSSSSSSSDDGDGDLGFPTFPEWG